MRPLFLFILSCSFTFLLSAQSFEDRSASLTFNQTGFNTGMAVGDVNNDGWEDVYVSRSFAPNLLYLNKGDFSFEEVAADYGINFMGNTKASLWFDMDNDGDQDLFLANTFESHRLFKNNNGQFQDVSFAYNVGGNANVNGINAVDFDNDGDLDIYITNSMSNNILLRNENGEGFVDYTLAAGIQDEGPSMAAIFFDYDNDGDQDLYQVLDNDAGNLFYRNDGGYFTEISTQNDTHYKGHGMGVDVADLNQDGLLDFYLTNLYENVLFIQQAGGSFIQFFEEGLDDYGMGWGTSLFDSNNNGKVDIYLANESSFGTNDTHECNKLFINQGNLQFFTPPVDGVLQNMHSSYGTATADFDRDGLLDLVVANYGEEGNQIFQNTSVSKNYIRLQLEGTTSNRDAIGAKVVVQAQDQMWMDVSTSGSSYVSQSSNVFHFGLEDATMVDAITIYWPSGAITNFENITPNQTLKINETTGLQTQGPVVWTEPAFPTQVDDVTVYFDAAEGNGALAGFTGDVYAHTGVITSASTAPNDWQHVQGTWGVAFPKTLMTNEGNDIYSLAYNIEEFYGINPGEVVEELAFVFRNVNGSIVGRDTDGSDIFTDVFPPEEGLLVNLLSPQDNNSIIFLDESLPINLQINKKSFVEIADNGMVVYSDSTQTVNFDLPASALGAHELEFTISEGDDTQVLSRNFFVLDNNETPIDLPDGIRSGVNYVSDSTLIFALVAPNKDHVFLLCPANNYTVDINYQFRKTPDETTFWIELPKSLFENGQNTYQYLVDGSIKVADPYSEVVLDPSNDGGVPSDVLAELPSYPTGLTSGIVTAFDLEENVYDWQVQDFEKPAKTDLVIYEILMRDFLEDKNYKSLLDTLDYLENLGINAIEFMPIHEFEGNQSWGYNPSFHMAVDKYYGSRDQLRAVIDACHERGIAVILDVVFNHAFSQSPLCQLYWNSTDFRPAPDNPWLNEVERHPFNVGYDFNHESELTKDWVKRNLEHWITEYKFDGFRFDLSKGLTQTNTGGNVGAWSQYDASRVNILKEYADHIWSLDDDSYVVMEHFAVNSEEKDLANYGMMIWGNMTHEFAEAAMGYSSDLSWADYRERDWNAPHLIAYMESHDEERMGYKIKNFGANDSSYDTRELATAVDRVAAASAIYLSLPGPKMFWQFGELDYDFSINRCVNGTINPDCRLDPKPIRWDYFENEDRRRLYDRVAAMTHLKTNYPTFATTDYTFHDGNFFLKTINLNHPEMDAVVMANYRISNSDLNPKFPTTGTWYEYFTGQELEVVDTQEKLTFGPGEYRIYTSEKIAPPNGYFPTSTEDVISSQIKVYPNLIQAGELLQIELPVEIDPSQLYLQDILGRTFSVSYQQNGTHLQVVIPQQNAGMYQLIIQDEDQQWVKKLIIVD